MSGSTINVVKYYFHKRHRPETEEYMRKLVAIADQTARAKKLYPQAIFIHSDLHGTISIHSVYQKDAKGPHITLCYKDDENMRKGTHVAFHSYIKDEETMKFKEAKYRGEKLGTTKKKNKKSVWPASEKLCAAPDIGYGHKD